MDNTDGLDLALQLIIYVALAVVAGAVVLGFALSVLAALTGGRTFGWVSVVLGLVVSIAVLVIALVVFRTFNGEATPWDWLWAVGLGTGGWRCGQHLLKRSDPPATSEPST